MDLIHTFFSNLQTTLDPLAFISVFIALFGSIYISRTETNITLVKERHEKLFFPLFDTLEPFLYQGLNTEALCKALKIIEENKSMVDGKLLSISYYCKKDPTDKNFNSLCSYVDHAYDRSCHRLNLKRRSLSYKLERCQYKNKSFLILLIFSSVLVGLLFLVIWMLFLASFMYIANSIYSSANDTMKIIYLLILAFSFMALTKFLDRHQ